MTSAGWLPTGKKMIELIIKFICVITYMYTLLTLNINRDVLITWGNFIVASLPDPGNQLCTDDFEGQSPHNVNLAAKVLVSTLFFFFSCPFGLTTIVVAS